MVGPALAEETAPAGSVAPTADDNPPADIQGAERFIRTKHNKVRAVLRRRDTPKRAEQLTELLGQFLDYDMLAQLSLDREWNERSPKERKRFVSLLRQLVERQYQRNMESTLRYKVTWVGSEALDGTNVLVKSSARSQVKKRQPPVAIDYSMHPDGNQWRVWDISTDGVSLVKNYKRQFRRVISDEGWEGLIGRMEKKLNEEEDELI
ncbi:MAG: ABC transporter substrate-binding protein [Myxococcales bacterium]|nr:ABC transporter substrate-binding protein [Myxococcales bacterium]MDH3484311.1 ABC transporter substrate-binding protein [Myxococcales bacterium]